MAMFSLGFDEVPIEEEIVNLIRWESERLKLETCCDIFGDEEPWLLFDKDVGRVHYVFVDLKQRNEENKGTRVERTAGAGGIWKCVSRRDVCDSNGKLIGFRNATVFEPRIRGYGDWVMHEYSTLEYKDDYLICAIQNRALRPPPEPIVPFRYPTFHEWEAARIAEMSNCSLVRELETNYVRFNIRYSDLTFGTQMKGRLN